jgi:hypothetical protein
MIDHAARERLMLHMADWVLGISATVMQEFPEDQLDEAMGIVLGSAIEHVMASGMPGQITNRIRFGEALNSFGGADWAFRYIDPERYSD